MKYKGFDIVQSTETLKNGLVIRGWDVAQSGIIKARCGSIDAAKHVIDVREAHHDENESDAQ